MGKKMTWLVVGVLGVVSVTLLVICGVSVVRTRAFLAESVQATGTVTGLVPRQSCSDEDGRRRCTTVYAPRIRFTTAEGRSVEFTSDTASSPPGFATGDEVRIRYRPSNPTEAAVDSLSGIWLGSLITGGIGVAFAGFAVLWLVIGHRTRPSSTSLPPEDRDDVEESEESEDPEDPEPRRPRTDADPSNPFL